MKFLKGRIESTNEFKECLLSLQHSTQQKSLLWLCRLCIVCPLPRRLTSTQRKSKSAFFGGEKRPAAMSNRNSSCLTFSNVVNLNPMTVNLWNEHVNHCQPQSANLPWWLWPGYCNTNWTIQFLGRFSWMSKEFTPLLFPEPIPNELPLVMPWPQLYKDPTGQSKCVKKGIQMESHRLSSQFSWYDLFRMPKMH